jgi:hypothetical protein
MTMQFVRVASHRQRGKLLGIIACQRSYFEWSSRPSKSGIPNAIHFYTVTPEEVERLKAARVKFTHYRPQAPRNLRESW